MIYKSTFREFIGSRFETNTLSSQRDAPEGEGTQQHGKNWEPADRVFLQHYNNPAWYPIPAVEIMWKVKMTTTNLDTKAYYLDPTSKLWQWHGTRIHLVDGTRFFKVAWNRFPQMAVNLARKNPHSPSIRTPGGQGFRNKSSSFPSKGGTVTRISSLMSSCEEFLKEWDGCIPTQTETERSHRSKLRFWPC